MAIMAIRRFGLTDELRSKMLTCAETIMDTSQEEKTKLLAVKMLAEMDKIDAKREETAVQQKHHEVLEATSIIRTAMQSPDMREKLAKISDGICAPIPIEPPKTDSEHHLNGNGVHK